MNVVVQGLWHLGSVTAACLASIGHHVTGIDPDPSIIARLRAGQAPLYEPGLDELVQHGLRDHTLRFTDDTHAALAGADVLWVAFDTPVDDDDRADTAWVLDRVREIVPLLRNGCLVLVSSQLPVGSAGLLELVVAELRPGADIDVAVSPENLRLGKAIEVFLRPDRIVVGARSDAARTRIETLLAPLHRPIEWMRVESAEMTKHAINAFLATSVVFANEIAVLCERSGADAREVERGLKTEARIGPGAYVGPGASYAGGTLARDIAFLAEAGARHELPMTLFHAVRESNDNHKQWMQDTLRRHVPALAEATITVLGLAYKPGTDTLRRSSAIELVRWLRTQGAAVRVHDPRVDVLPGDLQDGVTVCADALDAASGSDALVIATAWASFRELDAGAVAARMRTPLVVDQARACHAAFEGHGSIRYIVVGKGEGA